MELTIADIKELLHGNCIDSGTGSLKYVGALNSEQTADVALTRIMTIIRIRFQ